MFPDVRSLCGLIGEPGWSPCHRSREKEKEALSLHETTRGYHTQLEIYQLNDRPTGLRPQTGGVRGMAGRGPQTTPPRPLCILHSYAYYTAYYTFERTRTTLFLYMGSLVLMLLSALECVPLPLCV